MSCLLDVTTISNSVMYVSKDEIPTSPSSYTKTSLFSLHHHNHEVQQKQRESPPLSSCFFIFLLYLSSFSFSSNSINLISAKFSIGKSKLRDPSIRSNPCRLIGKQPTRLKSARMRRVVVGYHI